MDEFGRIFAGLAGIVWFELIILAIMYLALGLIGLSPWGLQ